ncbi:MAG: hypothetical protein OHK0029_04940 [Armatimonadaceae bacterium]
MNILLTCVAALLLVASAVPPVRAQAQTAPAPVVSPMPSAPKNNVPKNRVVPDAPKTDLPEPISVPPPLVYTPYLPFPHLPAIALDEVHNRLGIAQTLARARNLQARVLWVDATANIDRVNTAEKITALVRQIKESGFTTIVFDIKPIIGQTLYPSKYAPKLTEWVRPWKTQSLPADFDPLQVMSEQAKAQGIELIVSLNAFSEGHREFPGQGPADKNPQWQTILYVPELRLRPVLPAPSGEDQAASPTFPVHDQPNVRASSKNTLSLYTEIARVKPPADALLALLGSDGTVQAHLSGAALGSLIPALPANGAVLLALGDEARAFLQTHALPGTRLALETTPSFVPIGQRPDRQVPLMTNPHLPEVRQRILDMLSEVARNYAVSGFIFDDRLRYAGINADFSPEARRQFEAYMGRRVDWTAEVFRYEVEFPSLEQHLVPGPLYDPWLVFRALTMRNFLAEAIRTVKTVRPGVSFGTYVGSWYPDYPEVGANWAADDLYAGFRFLNDSYRQTGWAGIVDFVITGCYYTTATLAEAAREGISIGYTVEAAGQFSNRAVNDQTAVYAGLQLDKFKGKPEELKRALQAAAATTQGIMIFDLSHGIEEFWSVFAEAFRNPTTAPHRAPDFLSELRTLHRIDKAAGKREPAVILYRGASGTGF